MFTFSFTNEWGTLPNLPTGRYSGGCGVVRNDTGTYVVVVGGYYGDYSDVVEIYSVEEGVWTSGEGFLDCVVDMEWYSIYRLPWP